MNEDIWWIGAAYLKRTLRRIQIDVPNYLQQVAIE